MGFLTIWGIYFYFFRSKWKNGKGDFGELLVGCFFFKRTELSDFFFVSMFICLVLRTETGTEKKLCFGLSVC